LFRDARKLARAETSSKKTKLISTLLECNFVELVQKMWRQHLRPELLEKDEDLPDHIIISLGVNLRSYTLHCRATFCKIILKSIVEIQDTKEYL